VVNARNDLALGLAPGLGPIEWRLEEALLPYERALAVREARAAAVADGAAPSPES
jgi:hypothetical protein